jgi:hypothetical protein
MAGREAHLASRRTIRGSCGSCKLRNLTFFEECPDIGSPLLYRIGGAEGSGEGSGREHE